MVLPHTSSTILDMCLIFPICFALDFTFLIFSFLFRKLLFYISAFKIFLSPTHTLLFFLFQVSEFEVVEIFYEVRKF